MAGERGGKADRYRKVRVKGIFEGEFCRDFPLQAGPFCILDTYLDNAEI